jgi:hypothetical protein
MTRIVGRALAVVCGTTACGLLVPCFALAGSYVVHSCSPETSPGAWTQINTMPAAFASGNRCGGPEIGPLDGSAEGALYAEDILSSPANIPDGARAGWTITAPPGSTITAISYYRTLASHGSPDVAAGLFLPDGSPLEQCRIGTPFGSPIVCSTRNNQVPRVFSGLSTSSLFVGVLCDIIQPVLNCISGGAPLHNVQAYMYSARVTFSESVEPTVSDVGGTLWGDGLVAGTASVTFSAADASGIRDQAVQTAAGKTVVSSQLGCDLEVLPPCPQSPKATLIVDTTKVPDGTQTFQLVVADGAGNSRAVVSGPVTVDNFGPPPPVGLTATARAGSNAIALAWMSPSDPPAPVSGAMAQLCWASCAPPQSVGANGAAELQAPGPGTYTARVWLLDSAGRGGSHNAATAVVTVAAPQSVTRTRVRAVLHGRRLRVSGPIAASGRVRVSWRSKVRGRTVGHGSRVVAIREHRLRATFAIARRARVAAATIRIAVRRGRRVVGQARARRG